MPKSPQTPLSMMAIVYLAIEPAWLALTRPERREYAGEIGAITDRHADVSFQWFDADALSGKHSDFAVCRFTDMRAYHHLWEELRDTAIFARPFARITDVSLGIENGFLDYEGSIASDHA